MALGASRLYGRACKLSDAGRKAEALQAGRQGLEALSAPGVHRHMGPEGSTLMSLTIIVEQLADALGEAGADPRDLAWRHRHYPVLLRE